MVNLVLTNPRGCVTPKQIANMKEESGGDTDLIDGFDEVSEEFQDKVVRAIEQGTVDMADWKGVCQCLSYATMHC